jgi:hypothetical protein
MEFKKITRTLKFNQVPDVSLISKIYELERNDECTPTKRRPVLDSLEEGQRHQVKTECYDVEIICLSDGDDEPAPSTNTNIVEVQNDTIPTNEQPHCSGVLETEEVQNDTISTNEQPNCSDALENEEVQNHTISTNEQPHCSGVLHSVKPLNFEQLNIHNGKKKELYEWLEEFG